MKKYNITQLASQCEELMLVVLSMDNGLYQAFVQRGEVIDPVCHETGQPVRAFSIGQLYCQLQGMAFRQVRLRHSSAYDEMIGQPLRQGGNTLDVALDWAAYGQVAGSSEE